MVAALLAFFLGALGALGVHQFYLGHGGRGIAMLLLTMPEEQFDARYN
jgi:TM2 domain-containing membrane protein YozV